MRPRPKKTLLATLGFVAILGASLPLGCQSQPPRRVVQLEELERGRMVLPEDIGRRLLSDPARLGDLYHPLSPRFGIVAIHTIADWERLATVVPDLGDCPDLTKGMVVGLVSRVGLPLDGGWPLALENVRIHEGGGYVAALFHTGSYLPDASAHLELAYLPDLEAVLVVDVNGLRYMP